MYENIKCVWNKKEKWKNENNNNEQQVKFLITLKADITH